MLDSAVTRVQNFVKQTIRDIDDDKILKEIMLIIVFTDINGFVARGYGTVQKIKYYLSVDGLPEMGYHLATKVNIKTLEDVERTSFRVNPSYAHDLKDALDPNRRREADKQRRRRRS